MENLEEVSMEIFDMVIENLNSRKHIDIFCGADKETIEDMYRTNISNIREYLNEQLDNQ